MDGRKMRNGGGRGKEEEEEMGMKSKERVMKEGKKGQKGKWE